MVVIIDGEIVPDNDPRAIARRNPKSTPPRATGVAGVHGGAPRAGAPPAGAGRSPLDQLAEAIGVQGQSIKIPQIVSVPEREVPMIHVILVGGLSLFFGWRVLAAAAVFHVVGGLSDRDAAANRAGRAGAAPPR